MSASSECLLIAYPTIYSLQKENTPSVAQLELGARLYAKFFWDNFSFCVYLFPPKQTVLA